MAPLRLVSLLVILTSVYTNALAGWSLVAENKECGGSQLYKGKQHSVEACGTVCRGVASMFIFGTNDFGLVDWCNNQGCTCYCETSATDPGTCDIIHSNGYRLYKYTSGCGDQLPSGYGAPCSATCYDYSTGYCNYDWSVFNYCFNGNDAPGGKVKDNCKASCGECEKVECTDDERWVDKDGYGCDGYTECYSGYEDWANADGIDASSACCICGGGIGEG